MSSSAAFQVEDSQHILFFKNSVFTSCLLTRATYLAHVIYLISHLNIPTWPLLRGRDNSVGVATRLWAGRHRSRDLIPGKSKRFFLFPITFRLWGPPSLLHSGYGLCFPSVERHWREADHSLYLVFRLRMVRLYLHSPYAFIEWFLIN
jgi:hypothetical protein